MSAPPSPHGAGRSDGQLPPINFEALAAALLQMADSLVARWLPGGAQRGHEYQCGSLSGGAGSSCSVNLTNGRWADFATDDKGNDLISLYARVNDLTMGKAALQLAREHGLEAVAGVMPGRDGPGAATPRPPPAEAPRPVQRGDPEGWRNNMPVPPTAPAATFKHQYRTLGEIEHTATYRLAGQLLGYVVRFKTSDGGKETLPYTWCTSARDGASRWHWKQWDEPRPLYIPAGELPSKEGGATRTVVLVEGEKKADALHALLEAGAPGVYLVVSWPGGCKAWHKALWDWLAGCSVLLWPDCDAQRLPLTKAQRDACADDDARAAAKTAQPILPAVKQPGMAAMLGIGALLQGTHACTVQLLPIPAPGAVADGWDCFDAIQADGWDFERVLAFFGQAQPLPDDVGNAGAGGGAGKPPEKPPRDGPADAPKDDAASKRPWWLEPYWDSDKGRWLVSRKLVIKALEHDETLAPVLGYNQLSNNIDARVPWPWLHSKAGPITGNDDLMLGDYLSRRYGLPSIARAALTEAIQTVAPSRPFHPVREYLQGLHHDGVPRLDKWLVHVLGEVPPQAGAATADDKSLTPAIFEYLCLSGRYWLLGLVYRVMQPGCKFDYCPVLEGPGGFRKSTLIETLAGTEYFSDTPFDVARGKEGQEQVQGLWMYEIAELANFGKAEIGLIKAFITTKADRYRPSYGRTVEKFARQCVLAGSTNERTYLRDRTGNRRFWPIPVRKPINITWLAKYRDQLFAEAYAMCTQGVRFVPTPEEEARLFVPMQDARLVDTAVLSELTHVLTRASFGTGIGAIVHGMTEFVTIAELVVALGVDAGKSSPALESQIRSWMDHQGWERQKKQINGARAWGYSRPSNWPYEDDRSDAAKPSPAGLNPPASGLPNINQHEGADDEPF